MNSELVLPLLSGFPAQINQVLTKHLAPVFGEDESAAISNLLLEEITGLSRTEILFERRELVDSQVEWLRSAAARLIAGEPLQYILGKADFCGLKIRVGPGVLIPRPETEELVFWVLEDKNQDGKKVLDVCTGSGCIPLALRKLGNWSFVSGLDVSKEALNYAIETSRETGLKVDWILADVLGEFQVKEKVDVITANPPYVLQSESAEMLPQVLDFEPHLALFTPDSDAVLFYSAIARKALKWLNPGGELFLELNPKTAEQVGLLLHKLGFEDLEFRSDMFGKTRMLKARVPKY